MVEVYEQFRENYQNRGQYQILMVEKKTKCEENTPHVILNCDPLLSLFADINRNKIK